MEKRLTIWEIRCLEVGARVKLSWYQSLYQGKDNIPQQNFWFANSKKDLLEGRLNPAWSCAKKQHDYQCRDPELKKCIHQSCLKTGVLAFRSINEELWETQDTLDLPLNLMQVAQQKVVAQWFEINIRFRNVPVYLFNRFVRSTIIFWSELSRLKGR